jgi:hypothetical protein
VSLSLGYVVVPSFRCSSAPELLDAHSGGITGGLARPRGAASRAGEPLQVGFLAAPQGIAGPDRVNVAASARPGQPPQPVDQAP